MRVYTSFGVVSNQSGCDVTLLRTVVCGFPQAIGSGLGTAARQGVSRSGSSEFGQQRQKFAPAPLLLLCTQALPSDAVVPSSMLPLRQVSVCLAK